MTNPNDPAFKTDAVDPMSCEASVAKAYPSGLTKREYFAALAMQGAIAGSQGLEITVKQFAEQAVKLADALIAELNKG